MKIKSEFVEVSRVVKSLAEKYCLNKNYIWDEVEENFGYIKGTKPMLNQTEIDMLEDICKHALD